MLVGTGTIYYLYACVRCVSTTIGGCPIDRPMRSLGIGFEDAKGRPNAALTCLSVRFPTGPRLG